MKLELSLCSLIALGVACASDVDDRPLSWRYIHAAIIKPNCATSGCHSTLTQTAGVDLQDRDSALVVIRNDGFQYLDILELLKGDAAKFYRMPPDQPLPDADIDLISRWLDAGGEDN